MKEYKNLKVERLVAMLEELKDLAEKSHKEAIKYGLSNIQYWEGQLRIINHLLTVINIFK